MKWKKSWIIIVMAVFFINKIEKTRVETLLIAFASHPVQWERKLDNVEKN